MSNPTRRNILRLAASAAMLPVLMTAARADGHATTHAVNISGFAFAPQGIAIKAGDTVMFTNSDSAPHTATADNGSFDTGRLNGGQSASLTFSTPGTYGYFCSFHPGMKGTITVS